VDPESSDVRARTGRALQFLDRHPWWLSGILSAGVVIWADPADPHRWMSWLLFGLCLILLWIPAVVRIARGS
jgi:hypothetical protein